jgi:prepilin-type processing-associated H-X9-DG protein
MTAMTMYTSDFRDLLPPNPDDGNTIAGHNWCSGQAGRGGSSEFDPDLLKDPDHSMLAPYLKGNVTVFRCPADTRAGLYQGTDPALVGKIVSAARTFSMNQAAGIICPGYDQTVGRHAGAPSLPVNGRWLNNLGTHRRDSPWITYGKLSDIRAPGPANLWVLVDEDDSNLNDAAFAFGMDQALWIDAPGTYHDGGCGFAFADGHSESHHWKSTARKIGHRTPMANQADFQDWEWMRDRTSANISGVMPPPETGP